MCINYLPLWHYYYRYYRVTVAYCDCENTNCSYDLNIHTWFMRNLWLLMARSMRQNPLIAGGFGKARPHTRKCRAIKSDSKFGIMLITATVPPVLAASLYFIEFANCKRRNWTKNHYLQISWRSAGSGYVISDFSDTLKWDQRAAVCWGWTRECLDCLFVTHFEFEPMFSRFRFHFCSYCPRCLLELKIKLQSANFRFAGNSCGRSTRLSTRLAWRCSCAALQMKIKLWQTWLAAHSGGAGAAFLSPLPMHTRFFFIWLWIMPLLMIPGCPLLWNRPRIVNFFYCFIFKRRRGRGAGSGSADFDSRRNTNK